MKILEDKEKKSWKEGLEWLRTVLPLLFVIGGISLMIFSALFGSMANLEFAYGGEYEFSLLHGIHAMLISGKAQYIVQYFI